MSNRWTALDSRYQRILGKRSRCGVSVAYLEPRKRLRVVQNTLPGDSFRSLLTIDANRACRARDHSSLVDSLAGSPAQCTGLWWNVLHTHMQGCQMGVLGMQG